MHVRLDLLHFTATPLFSTQAPNSINAGIKKVIIGCTDPNPLVNNSGINKLREHGIEVITGVLEQECIELNKIFFHWIKNKTPWVTLKVAITLNGKMTNFPHKFITNKQSREKVHELRANHRAMLTTASTVLADDCQLNVRITPSAPTGETKIQKLFQPQRFILDRNNKLTGHEKIFTSSGGKTQVFHSSYQEIINYCSENNISSLMIEAGSKFSSYILKNKLFNELIVFQNLELVAGNSNLDLYTGLNNLDLNLIHKEFLGSDLMNVFRPT